MNVFFKIKMKLLIVKPFTIYKVKFIYSYIKTARASLDAYDSLGIRFRFENIPTIVPVHYASKTQFMYIHSTPISPPLCLTFSDEERSLSFSWSILLPNYKLCVGSRK